MVGKDVIVVCNLKPVKLRGVESQGMILAAGNDGDDLIVPVATGAKFRMRSSLRSENYVI